MARVSEVVWRRPHDAVPFLDKQERNKGIQEKFAAFGREGTGKAQDCKPMTDD
ncbi:MAG: hypothetical protein Kow0089_24850 [Desulfobulbaceae bacterium]